MTERRRLKALLVNDASLAGHHGSALVTAQICKLAAAAGIDVVSGWTWDAVLSALAAGEPRFDLILVNGEGSLHSSSQAARRIANIASGLAQTGAAPAYLINASVEGNSEALDRELASFRLRFVRDNTSQAYLAGRNVTADVVHDITLTASHLPRAGGSGTLLVTDASSQATTRRLIALARAWPAEALTLRARPPRPARGEASRQRGFGIKRQIARFSPLSPWSLRYGATHSLNQLMDLLAHGTQGMVCGRYHAVCFALRMQLPFVAVAGNTSKTGALLSDIGLDARLKTLEELEAVAPHMAVPRFSDPERQKIQAFLVATERNARSMFSRIADDAHLWHEQPATRSAAS